MIPTVKSPFLHDWLFAHAAERPEAPAVDTPSIRLTYGDLAERVRALAAHLAADGIGVGDGVLLALPNAPATVVAGLAVNALGATAVEVNREWGPEVLAGIVAQARVRTAVVWGRDARTWAKVLAEAPLDRMWVVHPTPLPEALRSALAATRVTLLQEDGRPDPALPLPAPAPTPRLEPASPALILYTSGSTGRPRGVVQTFANVDANSRSIVEYLGLGPGDRALVVLPLYYCYGRSVLQTHLLAGGSLFLDGRFAFPRVVLEGLASEGCTGFAGVPLTFEILRRQVDVGAMTFPRLRYLTQAGGAMAPETIDWVRKAFHTARLFVMYGQTEATDRLSYLPPERAEEKRGAIGIPIPGVTLQVVDEKGRSLPDGETGHLVARGGNVSLGYLDEPEETAAILHDGWLWTGDLARRDADGFFFHEGRSKEILKIGGHRVSPVEIEHALARHPDVAEAAVIGVADSLKGELAAAFVVARPGCAIDPEELRRFCREHLPAFKVPARVTQVEALPRNEAGKLLRASLAARASQA
jgi:long-chain acyl-CoA synthetase